MLIITSNTWKDYFISLPAIDDANANMAAYTTALAAEANDEVKLSDLLNDIDGINGIDGGGEQREAAAARGRRGSPRRRRGGHDRGAFRVSKGLA